MVQATATIKGLDAAMRALRESFPKDPRQQQRIVHGAMGAAARKSFLPLAKQLALRGDESGALSESLGVRVQSKRKRQGKAGGMEVVPVRSSRKAMAMYIAHYYTRLGRTPPASIIVNGIQHGHLVEFGGGNNPANSFLWASTVATPSYTRLFAGFLKKRIESAVRRKAKKARRK